MKKFLLWLENRELSDQAKQAIIGILPDELKGNTQDEDQLLQLSTKDLSSDILDKFKNLGIISNIKNDNPQRFQEVIDSIKNGITIKDLIAKISGLDGLGYQGLSSQPAQNPVF